MHQFVLLPSSHIPSISSVERAGFCSQTLHILIAVSCGFWVGTFLCVVEFAAGWWSQDPAVPNPINKAIDLFLRQMGRGLGKSASSAWASAGPAIFLNWGGRALLLYFIKGSRAKEPLGRSPVPFIMFRLPFCSSKPASGPEILGAACHPWLLASSSLLLPLPTKFFSATPPHPAARFISSPFPLLCFLYALGLHQNQHPCVSSAHVNVSLPGGMRYVVTLFRPQYRCTLRSVFVRV